MKIACDASRANRESKTGVEWYSFHVISNIIHQLSENDSLLLYTQDALNSSWGSLLKNIKQKELKWPPRYLWTHARLRHSVKKDKPDVFFIPAHVMPIGKLMTKTVITIHDVAFKNFPNAYSWKERAYQDFSIRYALKNADSIIVPTHFTADELKKFYKVDESLLNVVHHGLDYNLFSHSYSQEEKSNILSKYKITKPYALFVGRIESKKNCERMIQAFELMRKAGNDISLVFSGKPGFGFDRILELIKKNPYQKYIHLLGWTKQNELPILYQCAELFLYPTLYEGFGLPILESFAAGTIVITIKNGATSEIANGVGFFVDPMKTDEIYDAWNSARELSASDRDKIQTQGRKVASLASWDRCGKETLKIIRSIV